MLCEESYHIIYLFKRNSSGISSSQLSVFILREKSLSKGQILDNKNFYKIINQSKLLFTTLTKLGCLKTLNDFANVIYICIFKEAKPANCVGLK